MNSAVTTVVMKLTGSRSRSGKHKEAWEKEADVCEEPSVFNPGVIIGKKSFKCGKT